MFYLMLATFTLFLCAEHKLEELRRMKPTMTSRKRRALRLSVKEATSATELQKEVEFILLH